MGEKKAFTLVELLIVAAVFALIFILLTPFVNRMRERAYEIKCSNNIRLISLALHRYAADHNDKFPEDLRSLYPDYVKEESVFYCPNNSARARAAGQVDYEYVAGLSEAASPTEVIVYDRDTNHNKEGRNILRINGSVEWVRGTEGRPR